MDAALCLARQGKGRTTGQGAPPQPPLLGVLHSSLMKFAFWPVPPLVVAVPGSGCRHLCVGAGSVVGWVWRGQGPGEGGGPMSVCRWMLTTPRSVGPALPGVGQLPIVGQGGQLAAVFAPRAGGTALCGGGCSQRCKWGGGWGFPAGPPGQGMAWRRPGPGGLAAGAGKAQAGMARGGRCWAAGGEAWGWLRGVCSVKLPGAPFPQQAGSCAHWALSIPLTTLGSLLLSPCLFCPDKKWTVSACRRSASQP